MELGERKKKILKAIVEEYIKTGEPVGSKMLATNAFSEFSSATIRNEMFNLEEMGYIDKPHVSSGRIPSTLGYREYVDRLMNKYFLSPEEENKLTSLLDINFFDKTKIVSEAVKRISDVLGYTAIAVFCHGKSAEIMRFEIVCVSDDSIIIIGIDKNGSVKSAGCKIKLLNIPFTPETIRDMLNSRLSGVVISDENRVASLLYDFAKFEEFSPLIEAVKTFFSKEKTEYDVYYDGISNLVRIAEKEDIEKARELLWMLEKKEDFIRAVAIENRDFENMNFIIGDELPVLTRHMTSLVLSKTETVSGNNIIMGVMGPTRMNYAKAMASIDYLIRFFNKSLNE